MVTTWVTVSATVRGGYERVTVGDTTRVWIFIGKWRLAEEMALYESGLVIGLLFYVHIGSKSKGDPGRTVAKLRNGKQGCS